MKFLFSATSALIAAFGSALLVGCAHKAQEAPSLAIDGPASKMVAQAGGAGPQIDPDEIESVEAEPGDIGADLPKQKLTTEILGQFIKGELAAQRENYRLAATTFIDLARQTRDPRIARRAVDMAYASRIPDLALEASRLWLAAEPRSDEAVRRLVGLLISLNRIDEARPYLQRLLASEGVNQGAVFLQFGRLLGANPDRDENLRVVRELAENYRDLPEAHIAVAQAALQASNYEVARESVAQANKLKPDWELAALIESQIIQRAEGSEATQTYIENYLKTHPKARDMRLTYARLLTAEKKYPQAREQFELVLKENTADPDVLISTALLAAQVKDYDAAEAHFKRYLELETRNAGLARYTLGQIAEDRMRYDEAIEWYRGIRPNSEQYLSGQFRQAHIRAKKGDVEGARKDLQAVTPMTNQQRVQVVLVEAALLNDAGRQKDAFDVIDGALEKLPNDSELLYQQSMQAEKIGRYDVLESSLRKLIRLKPDYAHAYNALGYSLADRNERLVEAQELITKALTLAPEDYYIMDSMGWVLYRQGKHDEAVKWLRRAYNGRSDAEIAAHLGEVLWAMGQRDEARKLWAEALSRTPGNDVLLKTVQRFQSP
jgi:tetratricopeptide (TPR) repeat protein